MKKTARNQATKAEYNTYVLKEERDFEILQKCKALQEKNLDTCDARVICLIKTQLEDDWRTPLLKELKKTEKKYSHVNSLF